MALFRASPLRIQPYFGYRSASRLVLQARALRSGQATFEASGRWAAMRTMLAEYASHEEGGVPVTMKVTRASGETLQFEAVSDTEGFVRFDLDLDPHWPMPEQASWEAVQLSWVNEQGPQGRTAHVLAPGRQSSLAVISDIDDTIIETGITGGIGSLLRNWRRVLVEWPQERMAVASADVFYAALTGGETGAAARTQAGLPLPATNNPLFYVSSSPWNLYSYLIAFKRTKGLPLGPLMLRDWGLNRSTLGKSGHGGHKSTAIADLLDMFPQLRFALIGDDTQGDLPAFADIAAQHPGQIAAVFLRRISTDAMTPDQTAAAAAIRQAGVPLWMGASYSAGLEFLQSLHLSSD